MADGFIKPEDQEPDVTGFELYFDAFSELSSARQIGLGLGPIPFTAIVDYTRLFDIPDADEFIYVIRRMDQVYLELRAAEKPIEKKQPATKGKQQGGRR